jgi:hypothetical protein
MRRFLVLVAVAFVALTSITFAVDKPTTRVWEAKGDKATTRIWEAKGPSGLVRGGVKDDGHTTIKVDDKFAHRVIAYITTTQPVIEIYDDIPPTRIAVSFKAEGDASIYQPFLKVKRKVDNTSQRPLFDGKPILIAERDREDRGKRGTYLIVIMTRPSRAEFKEKLEATQKQLMKRLEAIKKAAASKEGASQQQLLEEKQLLKRLEAIKKAAASIGAPRPKPQAP